MAEAMSNGGTKSSAAIEGFNSFKRSQSEEKGKTIMSLYTFSNYRNTLHSYCDINEIPDLSHSTYVPYGGTNLYDAIGDTLNEISNKSGLPKKKMVVIITDGEHNINSRFSSEQIKSMIHARESDGWAFVYLGCSQDVWASSQNLGFRHSSTAYFSPTSAGFATGQSLYNVSASNYRSTGTLDMNLGVSVADDGTVQQGP